MASEASCNPSGQTYGVSLERTPDEFGGWEKRPATKYHPSILRTQKKLRSNVEDLVGPPMNVTVTQAPGGFSRDALRKEVIPDKPGYSVGLSLKNPDQSSSSSHVASPGPVYLDYSINPRLDRSLFNLDSELLPPRHRRPRNCQVDGEGGHERLRIDGKKILFLGIAPSITVKDIHRVIMEMGFMPHAVTAVSLQDDHNMCLEFSHSYLAKAAFSLLRQSGTPFWTISYGGRPTTTTSRRQKVLEVIDLTEDDDPVISNGTDDLYGGLSRSVYDETLESESESSNSSPEEAQCPREDISAGNPGGSQTSLGLFELPELGDEVIRGITSTRKPLRGPLRSPSRRFTPSDFPAIPFERLGAHVVAIPKSPHNSARRVLLPEIADLPILTVSMRADVQFFHRIARHRISKYSIPNASQYCHVVDAVIARDTAIVAYGDGPFQVSVVHLIKGRSPSLTNLIHNPHKRPIDSGPRTGNAAVSCLAAWPSTDNTIQFTTGGYDKTIRIWSVTTAELATSRELTRITTIPEALAFRGRSGLLVATSRKILSIDLEHLSEKPISTQTSNVVQQIHVHKQAPNVTILEVDSLDFQVQVYDDRKRRGFDRAPDSHFGGRYGDGAPSKFSRGDTHLSLFVKGYEDGTVCVWDYRNAKEPMVTHKHEKLGPIVHTVFSNTGVICYGKERLTFLDISEPESH